VVVRRVTEHGGTSCPGDGPRGLKGQAGQLFAGHQQISDPGASADQEDRKKGSLTMFDRFAAYRPPTIRNRSTRSRRFTMGAAAVTPALLIGVLASTAAACDLWS
jgi:hypothetical protein